MKLAIHQPYLFPYIGYFQLISAVDKFVVADNVQYIKSGWINGNRTLCNDRERIISLPVKRDSQELFINQRYFAEPFAQNKQEFLNKIRNDYRKAPYFRDTLALLELIMSYEDRNVAVFITNQLRIINDFLGIKTPMVLASEVMKGSALKGQDWVIALNKAMGADHYINSGGGRGLYSPVIFAKNGIRLEFIKSPMIRYKQYGEGFIPNLSIIDFLMFNKAREFLGMLQACGPSTISRKKMKVLIFPCGSEIGLEIHRSLKHSAHVQIIGASSVDDHGKYIYKNYISDLPDISSPEILTVLRKVVFEYQIDAIYPTMDKVIWKLKSGESKLGCRVISSEKNTTEICLSKSKTYECLGRKVRVPKVFGSVDEVSAFPIFIKPDVGYGSRGCFKASNLEEAKIVLKNNREVKYVLSEYLPGEEFTVDCFTDRKGNLLFVGPRSRLRIANGISVNTKIVADEEKHFLDIASAINSTLILRGAWFFQMKKDSEGELVLLEVASRLGGSSALYRALGVNFALLSIFDAFDIDVSIVPNRYEVEMDRALSNRYRLGIDYSTVYVDFDDCLVIDNEVNSELLAFLYQAINRGKRIILLTRHDGNLDEALRKFRVASVFDEIIHLGPVDVKSGHIHYKSSIFIDDSFAERSEVASQLAIPTFSPDMVECLYKS